jgi:hypothetical protein
MEKKKEKEEGKDGNEENDSEKMTEKASDSNTISNPDSEKAKEETVDPILDRALFDRWDVFFILHYFLISFVFFCSVLFSFVLFCPFITVPFFYVFVTYCTYRLTFISCLLINPMQFFHSDILFIYSLQKNFLPFIFCHIIFFFVSFLSIFQFNIF